MGKNLDLQASFQSWIFNVSNAPIKVIFQNKVTFYDQ